MKGKLKAKEKGFMLLEEVPSLEYIFKNWDSLEDNFYVTEYSYNYKDFKLYIRKYVTGIMRMWVYDYQVVIKNENNEIEITLDDPRKIQCWDTIKMLNRIFHPILHFYKNGVALQVTNHDTKYYMPIRFKELKILLRLTENENEIGNAVANTEIKINEKTLIIEKVNNKGKKYFAKRITRIPAHEKMMLEYRKITYLFAKMLLKKGILEKGKFRTIPLLRLKMSLHKKMNFSDIQYIRFFTMPIYEFNRDRVNLQGISYIDNFVIMDYGDDSTNQILFKMIALDTRDPIVSSEREIMAPVLCGVDYKNDLWCVSLSNLMLFWKIKTIYRFMYNLDDKTKIFEF